MSRPPVHVVRYGLIKACIWQNQTRNGERFTITINRLFKNGDQWKESQRFGRDDLLLVSKVADEAHTWVYQQNAVTRESQHPNKDKGAVA